MAFDIAPGKATRPGSPLGGEPGAVGTGSVPLPAPATCTAGTFSEPRSGSAGALRGPRRRG